MLIKDQLQRKIILKNPLNRIISLVPSQTEMLVDLGLHKEIVGITKFCIHPKNLRKNKTLVGGTKQVNYQKISDLKPDFILCNKEENTLEMVTELQTIAPTYVSDIYTLNDFYDFTNDLRRIFAPNPNFLNFTNTLQEKVSNFRKQMQKLPTKNKKVAYLIWANPYMAVGSPNFIDEMIKINGFTNLFSDRKRYPVIQLKDLQQADYVFLSSEPFPFNEKQAKEIKNYTNAKIIFVDGEMFTWYGTRLLKAFDYFLDLHKSL
ncbi:MAG TPA: cobalamin-binding protein [Flavobacteriia bacterium]|nr:cobalamin-binding protein [Flavobacteriia bacterium]